MEFKFWKYHGNGNDFVIINNLNGNIVLDNKQIALICDRRFGIGADGFIMITNTHKADFEMIYHNSDGNLASMCGNGGRCAAAYAFKQGIAKGKMIFLAFDGLHKATVNTVDTNLSELDISLQMSDVDNIEINTNYYFLDTGSPHYVEFVDHLADFDVVKYGRKTRYSEKFHPDGTNANFAELTEDRIFVRTYERGVEDETFSCGTGVTATAIAAYMKTKKTSFNIHTPGGDFIVDFKKVDDKFTDLCLRAPANEVYQGYYNI